MVAFGSAVAVEAIDQDRAASPNCTAQALSGYEYLYDGGVISKSEYDALRKDAIEDELGDAGDCVLGSGGTRL